MKRVIVSYSLSFLLGVVVSYWLVKSIDNLRTSQAKLCSKITQIAKKVDNLTNDMNTLKSQINSISKSLQQLDDTTKHIQKEVEKYSTRIEKLKSFILKINPKLDNKTALFIAKSIYQASIDFNVPIQILVSVAWQESHFNPNAYSSAGCIGIMQVNPYVWQNEFGIPKSLLWRIDVNIRAGAYVLRYYYEKTGSWSKAVYRYYGVSKEGYIYERSVLKRVELVRNYLKAATGGKL